MQKLAVTLPLLSVSLAVKEILLAALVNLEKSPLEKINNRVDKFTRNVYK